jgi:hypothetical protein
MHSATRNVLGCLKTSAITTRLPRRFRSAPLGVEREADAKGERQIWLERKFVDRLRLLRGPGESYSDVILRLAEPSLRPI